MEAKSQRMRWKSFEEDLLKSFLQTQRQNLIINMYKNIAAGQLLFRRETKLFQEMSKAVGRTSLQCKSKMQKFERQAYVNFLGVKSNHYDVFEWLRKKRSLKMRRRRKGKTDILHENDFEFKIKRQAVLQDIINGSFELNGKILNVEQYLGFGVEDFLGWIDIEKKEEKESLKDINFNDGDKNQFARVRKYTIGDQNNSFQNLKNSTTTMNKFLKNDEQHFLKKLIHVPSLKIFNNNSNNFNISSNKTLSFDFQISEMKMKIIKNNKPILELIDKRPEPKWIPVPSPPPKNLNWHQSNRNFLFPKTLRKDTKDTCLSHDCNGSGNGHITCMTLKLNQNILNHENSKESQNKNHYNFSNDIFGNTKSLKSQSDKTIDFDNSNNNHLNEKEGISLDHEKKEIYLQGESTNTLKDLINDLIATSDKLPKGSDCQKRLMSLVQKYNTQNFKSLKLH